MFHLHISYNNTNNIITNTFIYNSTELDSHIQAYKIQGNKMRRNVILNVIHTNSISFISINILT